jgi:hypothetical protein
VGCGGSDDGSSIDTSTGGAGGGSTGGAAGKAGSTSTGGGGATGGASGAGTGGASGKGGTSPTGGSGGSAGGSGGSTGGSGGSTGGSGGKAGGSGGSTGGTGGATGGSGGATGGSGGTAGGATGGSGGATGGAGGGTGGSTGGTGGTTGGSGGAAGGAGGSAGTSGAGGSTSVACDPVTNATYVVDPVNGDDGMATGSGTAGGTPSGACAFKTVTAAIAAIGSPATATTLQIVGTSTVSAGETFPFTVPANTTVTATGGVVTVTPPAGLGAFKLSGAASGIDGGTGLVVQGAKATNAALDIGVDVSGGAGKGIFVKNATIAGFAGPGIGVHGAPTLALGPGVTVQDNGYGDGAKTPAGIVITDTSSVVIDLPLGTEAPVLVTKNHFGGLSTSKNALVTITGKPGATLGTGTVVFSQSLGGPGIEISTTATGLTGSTLNGVVAYKNAGSGIRTYPDAALKVRNSVALGNGLFGVRVEVDAAATGTGAGLDFGKAGDYGLNVLQDPVTANKGAGICLVVETGASLGNIAVAAQGNNFGPSKDCSMMASSLSKNTTCDPGSVVDVGVVGATNSIDFKMCK